MKRIAVDMPSHEQGNVKPGVFAQSSDDFVHVAGNPAIGKHRKELVIVQDFHGSGSESLLGQPGVQWNIRLSANIVNVGRADGQVGIKMFSAF